MLSSQGLKCGEQAGHHNESVGLLPHESRLLPNGRSVTWGALFASVGDQISEQVARTGALLDLSSLSCKYNPSWN